MASDIQNMQQTPLSQGEIILYQPDETISLEVRVDDETVWLNRKQMADLFGRDVKTIGKHVNNALREELRSFAVVAKFATTAKDGKTYQVEYYNLDDQLYHFGASFKDLGRKLFAFERMGIDKHIILSQL